MKKHINLIVFAITLMFLASCSQRIMNFTLVTTKNVDLSKFPTYQKGTNRVEGKDKKPIIIIIPTGYPSGGEAIDKAIESVPGAVALLDGVLTYSYFYIPYIYGEYVFVVEGTPLIDPAYADNSRFEEIDDYSVCIIDESGTIDKTINYSPEEYEFVKERLFAKPIKQYRKINKS